MSRNKGSSINQDKRNLADQGKRELMSQNKGKQNKLNQTNVSAMTKSGQKKEKNVVYESTSENVVCVNTLDKTNYNSTSDILSVMMKAEDMNKLITIDFNEILEAWKKDNKKHNEKETGSSDTSKLSDLKKTEELLIHGHERYREKVLEIEERVISSGIVGDVSEFNFDDPFIVHTEFSEVILQKK